MNICFSPSLIAAYHVFLRLLVPSHSPYALSSLTYFLRLMFTKLNLFSFRFNCFYILSYASFTYQLFSHLSIYFSMCYLDNSLPMVEVRRVELLTSCLQGRRSSQTELYPQMQVSHLSNFQCTIKVH